MTTIDDYVAITSQIADGIDEVKRQRDLARRVSVKLENECARLEAENAELVRHIVVQAAAQERYRDVVRACEQCAGNPA